MEWITYSWLACCATAPSVAATSIWMLFIFHTYRRRWKTMDIFLLTIALQEIPSSLCAFGFAVHTVIRSRSESSCSLVLWGLTTIRVFQLTTLTSLAFDRALTLKWPYKYRFSVRQSQISYHIVVLGVISCLVGIAGLFARMQFMPDFGEQVVPNINTSASMNKTVYHSCSIHPFSWDYRYNIFISALYGILAFITFICIIYIEIHRFRGHVNSRSNSRISSVGNLVADHLGSSEAIGRCESYRTLYGFQTGKQGSINKKILDDQRAFDLRWAPVIGSLSLCYAFNHGPYIAFMIAGLLVQFWNPLHDNIVLWFSIIESMLLPIMLYITDDPFRDAVKRSFKRRNYRCADVNKSSDGPFPLYFNDFALIDKPYVGAMSCIPTAKLNTSPLTVVSNYRRSLKASDKCRRNNANNELLRTNSSMSSLRKCKLPKTNDRYMFLSIYGVDKVIPVNKQNPEFTDSHSHSHSANPYYKNCTTISTFADSDGSMKKEKPDTTDKLSNKDSLWYGSKDKSAMETTNEDTSWESHTVIEKKEKNRTNDEHIYATLSETFSVLSTLPDKRQLLHCDHNSAYKSELNCNEPSITPITQNYAKSGTTSVDGVSMSGVSFTTIANDDFEFTKGDAVCMNTMQINNDKSFNHKHSSSESCESFSVEERSQPKGHIYDNLAFDYENDASIVTQPNLLNPSGITQSSSVSALNYLQRRYSPFVSKSNSNNTKNCSYYKRRGRQSFSTSDIHKLESPIYSLQAITQSAELKEKCSVKDRCASATPTSQPLQTRKTQSETNLLLSNNNKSGSLTKISEIIKDTDENRQTSSSRELYETQSSDSVNSSSSSSSWDIHNKLAEVLKRKNDHYSAAIRHNEYMSRAKSRIKAKKYRVKKREPNVCQVTKDFNDQNMPFSQSLWTPENRPIVSLNGINRIGSYAQEWHNINKSMPNLSSLSSLASCPSPVFSPLYKKHFRPIGSQAKE